MSTLPLGKALFCAARGQWCVLSKDKSGNWILATNGSGKPDMRCSGGCTVDCIRLPGDTWKPKPRFPWQND